MLHRRHAGAESQGARARRKTPPRPDYQNCTTVVPRARLARSSPSPFSSPSSTVRARRGSILPKRIASYCASISAAETAAEIEAENAEARVLLRLLLATDEIRTRRLDVGDEVRNGLHHLAGVIWNALPMPRPL